MDDDLGLQWLEHFNKHTEQQAAGCNHLLILDGHHSHQTPEFILKAWEYKIVCLCLPLHSTHLLQPLDVSIFGPLQKAYCNEVDHLAGGNVTVTKKDFIQLYEKARVVLTNRLAWNAFKAVGIEEDPDKFKVLQRMPNW